MSRLRQATLPTLSAAEQEALAERCIRGDRGAREEFLRQFARLAYSVIARLAPRFDGGDRSDTIEDLFGQTFAALFEDSARRLRQWDHKCSLASWVRVVTASTVLDAMRASSRHGRFASASDEDPDGLAAAAPSALDAAVRVEELARLAEAIERLAPADRDLVRMIFAEDVAPGEAARRLGIPPGALYTRKNRALERLRAAFLGIDGEDRQD